MRYEKVAYDNTEKDFYVELLAEVDLCLKNNNITSRKGDFRLFVKTIVLFPLLIGLFTILVFFTPSYPLVSILLCILAGFTLAGIGFCVMHDVSHKSYSEKKWVTAVLSFVIELLAGVSMFLWGEKHVIRHHTYVNVNGSDDDINAWPIMRLNHEQKRLWFHRGQAYYALFAYALLYVGWVFIKDVSKYLTGKIDGTKMKRKMTIWEHVRFWITKAGYCFIWFYIPIQTVGTTSALIGYAIIAGSVGILISIVFQLAHIVESSKFKSPDAHTNIIPMHWARRQVEETANFAMNNKLVSWFTGGLNFQIEHHLLPNISHVYYPLIQPVVEKKCQKYGYPYNTSTGFKAIVSHFKVIHHLGKS